MVLSEGIRQLRKEHGMTLWQIALKLGVTQRTVQNYEKGKTEPKTKERYFDLCEIIEKTVSENRRIGEYEKKWII